MADRILALIAEGRSALDQCDADQWKVLALTRFELLRALDAFVIEKDRILAPILARGDEADARLAATIRAGNHGMRQEYGVFTAGWSIRSPTSVDSIYTIQARRMAELIERQLAADMQAIATLTRTAAPPFSS